MYNLINQNNLISGENVMAIKDGNMAVEFMLKDQTGNVVKLSTFKGNKKVLLSFHPLAWTDVCARQMESLEMMFNDFTALNTVCLGISVDTAPSKKAWAKSLNITKTSLPCDFWPHGEVARNYGVFRERDGFSERANILMDEEQKIIFSKVYSLGDLPDLKEILEILKK